MTKFEISHAFYVEFVVFSFKEHSFSSFFRSASLMAIHRSKASSRLSIKRSRCFLLAAFMMQRYFTHRKRTLRCLIFFMHHTCRYYDLPHAQTTLC